MKTKDDWFSKKPSDMTDGELERYYEQVERKLDRPCNAIEYGVLSGRLLALEDEICDRK